MIHHLVHEGVQDQGAYANPDPEGHSGSTLIWTASRPDSTSRSTTSCSNTHSGHPSGPRSGSPRNSPTLLRTLGERDHRRGAIQSTRGVGRHELDGESPLSAPRHGDHTRYGRRFPASADVEVGGGFEHGGETSVRADARRPRDRNTSASMSASCRPRSATTATTAIPTTRSVTASRRGSSTSSWRRALRVEHGRNGIPSPVASSASYGDH